MARRGFIASIPERLVRSLAAVIGGALHETGALVLPRFVRQSRLYEATAKNLLRVLIEGVGSVEGASTEQKDGPDPGQIVKRKVAGNVVQRGLSAPFGCSPRWILAAASDVVHGSRTYLDSFVRELKAKGVI